MSKAAAPVKNVSQMQSNPGHKDTVMSNQSVHGRAPSPNVSVKPTSSLSKRVTPEDIYDEAFGEDRFKRFIIKPSHIKRIWAGSNMKEELFNVFHEQFKPRSSLEPERVEYNEKNFLSEF